MQPPLMDVHQFGSATGDDLNTLSEAAMWPQASLQGTLILEPDASHHDPQAKEAPCDAVPNSIAGVRYALSNTEDWAEKRRLMKILRSLSLAQFDALTSQSASLRAMSQQLRKDSKVLRAIVALNSAKAARDRPSKPSSQLVVLPGEEGTGE